MELALSFLVTSKTVVHLKDDGVLDSMIHSR